MNRRSFIAAACGAAVAPWVKVKADDPLGICTCESRCDKCRAALLSAGMPAAMPEKFYSITKEIMA